MVEKLKECPFCGGEGIVTAQHMNGKLLTWVQCQNRNCGASTHVDIWNTRHQPTEVSELLNLLDICKLFAIKYPLDVQSPKIIQAIDTARQELTTNGERPCQKE